MDSATSNVPPQQDGKTKKFQHGGLCTTKKIPAAGTSASFRELLKREYDSPTSDPPFPFDVKTGTKLFLDELEAKQCPNANAKITSGPAPPALWVGFLNRVLGGRSSSRHGKCQKRCHQYYW